MAIRLVRRHDPSSNLSAFDLLAVKARGCSRSTGGRWVELLRRDFWAPPVEEKVADILYVGSIIVIGLVAHAAGVR